MQALLATQVVNISELKRNPRRLMELVDDHALQSIVADRLSDKSAAIKVSIDDL